MKSEQEENLHLYIKKLYNFTAFINSENVKK